MSINNSGYGSPTNRMIKEYHTLLRNPVLLNKWFEENYEKVVGFDIFYEEIVFLLDFYIPGTEADEVRSPRVLAKMLSHHLLDIHTRLNKFNIELGELSEVNEDKTLGKIENHKIKVFKVMEEYEEKLRKANEEVIMCKEHIAYLNSELTGALINIQSLDRGLNTGFLDESLDEATFIADLQGQVAATDSLNSSMKQQLKQSRDLNMQLQLLIFDMRKQSVIEQEECMVDLAESAEKKESCLEDTLKAVLQSTNSTAPNEEMADNIIEEWRKSLKESISKNEDDINMLLDKMDDQDSQLSTLRTEGIISQEKLEDVKFQANRIKEMIELFEEEIDRLNKYKEEITSLLDDARIDCHREIEKVSQHFSNYPQQYASPSLQAPGPSYVQQQYYEPPQVYPANSPNYSRKRKSAWKSRRRIFSNQWDI